METENDSKPGYAHALQEYSSLGNKQKVLAYFYDQQRNHSCTAATVADATSIELKLIWNDTADLQRAGLLEQAGKEGRFKLYRLAERGRRVIESWLESWHERQSSVEPDAPFDVERQIDFAKRVIMHTLTERHLNGNPRRLLIPLDALLEFPDFADFVLDQPDQARATIRAAFDKLDLPTLEESGPARTQNLDVIFLSVPESQSLRLSNIGHEHLDRLFCFDAILSKMTELHTRVTLIKYECPSCAQVIPVAQPAMGRQVAPTRCMCGRKGKFRIIEPRERMNTRFVTFEEPVDIVDSQMSPVKKPAVLNNSLASPETVKSYPPGSRVRVIAIPRESEQARKDGGTDVVAKFYLEVVNVIPLREDIFDLSFTDADHARCLEIAKNVNTDGTKQLVESYSPYVAGLTPIKEALLLMSAAAKNTLRPGELKISRKTIHILLIGDTGTAKTTLAKSLLQIVPRSRFAMAAGQSSSAGLIGAVEKDTTFNQGWSLEAGELVLAHGSVCVIDEIDKMKEEEYNIFLEIMEDQSASISKAVIKTKMAAWTGVLGLANPKNGRFDDHIPFGEQIKMPSYLLNRFDLIITLPDTPDTAKDEATVDAQMDMQLDISNGNVRNTPYTQEELRKYIQWVRQQPNPTFTPEAAAALKRFYLPLRSQYKQTHQVAINARVMESILRLSFAYARIRLSSKVEAIDADRACKLYTEIMRRVLTDMETGNMSIDQVENPTTTLERVKYIILTLEMKHAEGVPIPEILREAAKLHISEDDVSACIKKLKHSGDIFSPKADHVRRYA